MTDLNRSFKFDQRQKSRQYNAEPYGLPYAKWNEVLRTEFAQYRKWRTSEFVPDRPRRLQQRDNTFNGSVKEFECYFGYLVNIQTEKSAALRLTRTSRNQTGFE